MNKKLIFIFILLALVNFTNILDFMVMMPMASVIKADLSMNAEQWGWVVSAYSSSAFISGVISVFIIDHLPRKKFLLVIYLGFLGGTLFCGLSNTYEQLISARIVAGFFGGIIGAIVLSILTDIAPEQHRGHATGIVMAGFSAAAALGVPIGLWMSVNWNWHTPFMAIVVVGILIWIALFIYIPMLDGHLKIKKEKSWFKLVSIFKDWNQIYALLFMVAILFGQFLIIPYLADYMVQNVGFKEIQLSYMYFFGGAIMLVTNPLSGKLADKYGRLNVFTFILVLSFIPIYLITNMGSVSLVTALVVSTMFFIFTGGRVIPGVAMVISTAVPQRRGTFMSVRSAVQQLAGSIAVIVSSQVVYQTSDMHYHNFHIVGYIAIGTGVISYLLLRKVQQRY